MRRAARESGATNAEAEADKRVRHPVGRCVRPAKPLALETFGRHGREALLHLRQLARRRAESLDEEGAEAAASALVSRWGRWFSVALHRASARNLRASLGGAGAVRDGARQLAAELAS